MTEQLYPIVANAALVDESDIRDYVSTLFSRVLFKKSHFICLRGIGEKGTAKAGTDKEQGFRSDQWIQPAMFSEDTQGEEVGDEFVGHIRRWSQYHIASYIVPAVLREARGTSEAVEIMPCVVLDIDSGDTEAKATWIEQHIGTPTMAVASGGSTETGHPKMHLYWVFDEPSEDIAAVVEARHVLAEKIGGDLSFGRGLPSNPLGRAHQPIRVPGSVHAKNGGAKQVKLLWQSGPYPDFVELAWRIRSAPQSPWRSAPAPAAGALDFGPTKNQQPMDVEAMLMEPVGEGGSGKDSRFGRFSAVAGHHISLARRGELSLEQARAETYGWMLAKMQPPYPDGRFESEWHRLVEKDRREKGEHQPRAVAPTVEQLVAEPEKIRVERRLENWAVHLWTQEKAPPRDFVVRGLVLAAKPHLFVAEGGAGKTFATLDLALKVSSLEEGEDLRWLGMPVERSGTVVVLTTEDDKDELHRRPDQRDEAGRRFRAGRRLIVMPTLNAGGGFTMAERKRDGTVAASRDWAELQAQLRLIPDLALVVIDTLNSTLHGEENSATVINEYVRMIHPICGELGAALMLTHHIRKQNNQAGGQVRPISSQEDMFNAIRGSSALPAAFRVVLGMWHSHDYGKRMKAMGLEPEAKRLWRFGVLKANNPEMVPGIRFLLRNPIGMVEDATDAATSAFAGLMAEREAWLEAAVRHAADAGRPYKAGGKDAAEGLYQRRTELHACLKGEGFGRTQLLKLAEDMVSRGRLAQLGVPWRDARRAQKKVLTLDVPDGAYASNPAAVVEHDADYEAPDWDKLYRYDEIEGAIIPAQGPAMVFGRFGASAASERRTNGAGSLDLEPSDD